MPRGTVDIIGIVSQLGEAESINLKSGGSKMRRHVQVADESGTSISVTLWGDELCERNDLAQGEVLAIKGGKISEFGGRSLNCSGDSSSLYTEKDLKKEKRFAELQ